MFIELLLMHTIFLLCTVIHPLAIAYMFKYVLFIKEIKIHVKS